VPLSVRLEGGPGITLPPRAAVFIAGYGPDGLDDGLPRQGSRPLLYWSREAQPISLPATFSARALVGASHIAIVDADGDGAAGPGDWVSAPVPVPQKPSGPLTFRIERRFEPRGALTSGGPLGGATPPALPPALRGLERKLRLSVASGLAAPNSAPAFVLGFPDSAMLEGSPRAGVRPLFAWQSPRLQLAAPVEFLGQLPADLLTVVVVVDVDDDGQPGPGDLMSAPRPSFRAPGGSDAVAFVLDRSFSVPQKGPGPQQGPTTNDEDVKDRGAEPILPSWLRGGK
jgi:hypothetical protein